MCAKKWDIRAANDYGKDRCPMSQKKKKNIKWEGKVPHDETGWKGALCKILCPIGMGGLMCNEISSKQWEG